MYLMVGISGESLMRVEPQETRQAAHDTAPPPHQHKGITLIQELRDLISELLSVLANLGPKEGPQIDHFFLKTFFILDLIFFTF